MCQRKVKTATLATLYSSTPRTYAPDLCFVLLDILSPNSLGERMPHFTYSLILGDTSFEKLGPCLSPRYIQACSPAKCYVLFQADPAPPDFGRKVHHLKPKHTLVCSLLLLGASSHNTSLSSWLQSVAEGMWGMGAGSRRRAS